MAQTSNLIQSGIILMTVTNHFSNFIGTSFEFTRLNVQDYKHYRSKDYSQERTRDVDNVIDKVKLPKKTFRAF